MLLTRLLALDTRLLEPDTELAVSCSAEMVMGCTLVTPYGEHVRDRYLLGANKVKIVSQGPNLAFQYTP